jgi:hypothetical protein
MFEDFFGDLSKLKQNGSMRDYQAQFERLLSRVGRLSTEHQLGCFISGLKDTIQPEVQAGHPTSCQAQFERLLSRVGRLSTEYQLVCFISGLKDTIRPEVQAGHPTNLIAAIGLAQLYEAKHQAERRNNAPETKIPLNLPPMSSPTLTWQKNP